jgi:DNA-binding CsgD family transcriptional regulator
MEKILKMYLNNTYADQLISANEFTRNTHDHQALIQTTKQGMAGKPEPFLNSGLMVQIVRSERHSLSEREIEVIRLVVAGQSSHEIADGLFISEHTVRTHRKNIFKKLGIHHITQLMKFAISNGIS